MDFLIVLPALAFLAAASVSDLMTREVPDLVNYGFVAFALFLRIFLSIFSESLMPLAEGIAGFAFMLAFAMLFFYTGQMGGGDAKLLMGLGMLVGIPLSFHVPFLADFLMNSLIAGAVYSLAWAFVVGVKNFKEIKQRFNEFRKKRSYVFVKVFLFILVAFSLILMLVESSILMFLIMSFTAGVIILFYMSVYLKIVQECCFIKRVPADKVTVGDWVYETIKYGGKKIIDKKNLGVDEKQLKALKKIGEPVLVKYGIPFVPAFLLGFVITLLGFSLFSLFF